MARHKTDKKSEMEEKEELLEETGQRVSGEPESHLAAIGGGGIAGAATGAAVGTAIGGPVGAVVGAVAGAVAGAAAGEKAMDTFDPKVEEAYWQENFVNRPYYKSGEKYERYLPAYKFGWEAAFRKEYENREFDEIESKLKQSWRQLTKGMNVEWADEREIIRDAYDRIHQRRIRISE